MKMTFGVCTNYDDPQRLRDVTNHFQYLPHSDGEVIVAGPEYGEWLPQKKNKIAQHAKYDVIVMMHDYFILDASWFPAYDKFGYDWDVCSNPQFLSNGHRHFTDWVTWDSPKYPRYSSLDYNNITQTKHQYISGGFFLVKKQFLLENPLNEELKPGAPEDLEWSFRIRDKAKIRCNPFAIAVHNKHHRDLGRWGYPFQQEIHCDVFEYKKRIGYYD